jgi:hypothetical protein
VVNAQSICKVNGICQDGSLNLHGVQEQHPGQGPTPSSFAASVAMERAPASIATTPASSSTGAHKVRGARRSPQGPGDGEGSEMQGGAGTGVSETQANTDGLTSSKAVSRKRPASPSDLTLGRQPKRGSSRASRKGSA